MKHTFRRSALASALALALAQAHAAPIDNRALVQAQSPDAATIELAASNPDLLILRGGIFDPASQQLNATMSGAADTVSTSVALVQFHPDSLAAGRAELESKGAHILGYVPNNAFLVRLNGNSLADVSRSTGVRAAEYYAASYKVDPRLWQDARSLLLQQQPDDSSNPQELLDIIDVRGFHGVSSAKIEAALRKLVPGVRIISRSQRAEAAPYVHAGVPRGQLDQLLQAASQLESVAYIEPWLPTILHNSASIGTIQGNSLNTTCAGNGNVCGPTPIWDHGIFGGGQIVAVADSGTSPWVANFTTLDKGSGPLTEITLSDNPPPVLPAIGNTYANRKILAYWLQPSAGAVGPVDYDYTSGHGTHTSGTVIGDIAGTFPSGTYLAASPTAANHEQADGMAPNAQLILQDIGGTSSTAVYATDFGGTLQQAYAGGARVHNNSWGSSTGGVYSSSDSIADAASWANEDLLIVISAGNNQAGPVQTGSPSNAKNVLSVAALGHAGSTLVAGYSNRGPAADGRMKPDIAAPGSGILSADNTSTFSATPVYTAPVSNSGTSMSAPTISGNAALARQFFADGFYPRGTKTAADRYNPSGMAMKAVLLNGTNPLGAPSWPNSASGWGRAWLDSNLWFNTTLTGGNDSRRLRVFERTIVAGLQTGDMNEYTISNVQVGQELRATLTWFDPEATAGAALSLVNNLDLEVVGPGATLYRGNVFTAGISTTGGAADMRDTVEQVRLTAPAAGSYTFRVKGTSVPGGARPNTNRQGYALAVSGAFGLPDLAPFAAPTALAVTSTPGGASVAFSAAGGAQGFQLYRAAGTCAGAAAGDFRLIGSGTSSPLVDTHSEGGFGYAYTVRGISNNVEGNVSACVDATYVGACSLQPSFDGTSVVGGASLDSTCKVPLAWSAGTSNCPLSPTVTYSVQRSSSPYFTSPTTIATDLATTNFEDFSVVQGAPYYYKVLAADEEGNLAPISKTVSGTAIGPNGIDGNFYLDDGDTHVYVNMESPWQVTNTAATAGTLSYHNGPDGGNYPAGVCSSMTSPPIVVQPDASLNFKMKYNIETGWDVLLLEVSTNGGTTWVDLPPNGGYPASGTITNGGNACGYPVGKTAFAGSTSATPTNDAALASFQNFSASLAAYSGQTIQLRWRFSSDGGYEVAGAFLDEIRLTSADRIFVDGFDPANPSFTCSPD